MIRRTAALTTDLSVEMVVIDGNLGLQVQIARTQVFRVVLLDAAREIGSKRLEHYACVAPDLAFHVGNALEMIEVDNPQ